MCREIELLKDQGNGISEKRLSKLKLFSLRRESCGNSLQFLKGNGATKLIDFYLH
jgi:hypothetical protein